MDVLHVCIVFYKLYTFNCDYLHANVLISLSIYIDIIKCTYNSIKKNLNIWLKYIFKYIYSSDKPVLLDDVAAAYMYEKDCYGERRYFSCCCHLYGRFLYSKRTATFHYCNFRCGSCCCSLLSRRGCPSAGAHRNRIIVAVAEVGVVRFSLFLIGSCSPYLIGSCGLFWLVLEEWHHRFDAVMRTA